MSFPATISTFRLDKYEVTVGRFRAFVTAGMGTQASAPAAGDGAHANIPASGWNTSWNVRLPANTGALLAAVKCGEYRTWTDAPGPHESRPMNCVNWFEAMAFCIWDGGFLPTEAEWNYAATGGDAQRAYPWSDPPGAVLLGDMHASYNDGTTCIGDGMAGCAVTDLVKVGTKPAGDGRWGHSDLAGNAWEWALDYFRSYRTDCIDCAELMPGTNRVIRGGSFFLDATNLRASFRTNFPPTDRTDALGVRCARPQ
jgi:formylglycine-generating enzyme required for sulfatase activity